MPLTKILLADDHKLLRDMLRTHLDKIDTLEVVATADDGAGLIGVARETKPDVIVVDVDMPGLSCFDATRRVCAMLPDVLVVFLSAHTHDHYIEQALGVGAKAYVRKDESLETVVAAIRDVIDGKVYFSQEVLNRLVLEENGVSVEKGARSKASLLTPREREVLQYLAKGLAKKEIAGIMNIGTKTVEKHTENLMSKLDIHDRVQLALFAIREGLAGDPLRRPDREDEDADVADSPNTDSASDEESDDGPDEEPEK